MVLCLWTLHGGSGAIAADWLALDVTQISGHFNEQEQRRNAHHVFNDDVTISTTTSQNIRAMMGQIAIESKPSLVDALISTQEVKVLDWLANIPVAQPAVVVSQVESRAICRLDARSSRVECGGAGSISTSNLEPVTIAPVGRDLVQQIARQGGVELPAEPQQAKKEEVRVETNQITLTTHANGLVYAVQGKISFDQVGQEKKVFVDDKLQGVELSIFVRDPSMVQWDQKRGVLKAERSGATEIFVVTPGRISIIESRTNQNSGALNIASDTNRENKNSAKNSDVHFSKELVSLDGFDQALNDRNHQRASHGKDSTTPEDLKITEEVASLGSAAHESSTQIYRTKSKVKFENVKLKFVDDRSQPGYAQYPVSGVKVKVAGTEFSDLTNSLGEVEIKDVPSGARLLLDVSDDRGHVMPQVVEVVVDRDSVARSVMQAITLRRFSSLDFAARAAGLVQNMQKASFCGMVQKSSQALANVRVSLDAKSEGPFYFNNLGYLDVRLASSSQNGRFCFFNVEPGPITIGFSSGSENTTLAGVVGAVSGRHLEESFDLSEAKFVSTTLTTISSAHEQLGSDESRAAHHDMVEQADMYAIGSGELMVPVESGVMTTANAVLPIKGRVWTVSSSSDFETSVQAIPIKNSAAKQISTLIPNGFINDMSTFAATSHNGDEGSVVVEHGHVTGTSGDGAKMRLVDLYGRDIGDGWYFSDRPVAKAVFFNVPPGVYALVVEASSGHWLAADTVMVYNESVSFVKTGSPLEKMSPATQHASISH